MTSLPLGERDIHWQQERMHVSFYAVTRREEEEKGIFVFSFLFIRSVLMKVI
jgi:hypothetical protein